MIERFIIVVLDGFGVGELPDACDYHDEGSNTLLGIYNNTKLNIPNLKKMGLYNIDGIEIPDKEDDVIGSFRKSCRKITREKQPSWALGDFGLR